MTTSNHLYIIKNMTNQTKLILPILIALFVGFLVGNSGITGNGASNVSDSDGDYLATTDATQPAIESKTDIDSKIVGFFSGRDEDLQDIELNSAYKSTAEDLKPFYTLPEKPDERFTTGNLAGLRTFQIETELEQNFLHIYMEEGYDIDGDNKEERIYFLSTGASDIPQYMLIVKNGQVIFDYSGATLGFEKVSGEPGFILTTFDRPPFGGTRVRYVVEEDGLIKPIWQQRFVIVR